MKTPTFASLGELRPYLIRAGMHARVVNGERMTMAVIDLEPNSVAEEHHHENEQLGFVIRGMLSFRIGSETQELHPGDTYAIPSNLLHQAKAGPQGATVLDVFAPTRADWEKLPREEPFPGDWP
jgi:quercetin dioxygenase-like cupin family protein